MAYKNKEDQAAASRRHYEKNRAKIIERSKHGGRRSRARNKEFIKDYLKDKKCTDCGLTDPRILEFDHVRGEKTANVADLSRRGYGIKAIEDEIAKCEVRCANCHRIKTHNTIWNVYR